MNCFQAKTILITGGTSGIGLATAKRLTGEGARLVITGHDEAHIAATRERFRLQSYYGTMRPIQNPLTNSLRL